MKTWMRKLTRESAVIFIAGAILSAAADIIIGASVEKYIGVLLIFVSLFILYTAITLRIMHKEISVQLDQIGLTSLWIYEPAKARESYKKAAEIVRSARREVLIISHYVPPTPSVKTPEARENLFFSALEKVIAARLEDPATQAFTYSRIVQSDEARVAEGILREQMLGGDPQGFEHCNRVFGMLRDKRPGSNVSVRLVISEPIPSFPSMMIVDDRYMLFAFTCKSHGLASAGKELGFAGALVVEDRSGKTVQGFKNIFDGFLENSYPIRIVEDSNNKTVWGEGHLAAA